jgi:hypothetical protein
MVTTEAPLPKVTVQVPRRDANGRWTLSDLHVADAESMQRDDLVAALEYILAEPRETLRRIKHAQKR